MKIASKYLKNNDYQWLADDSVARFFLLKIIPDSISNFEKSKLLEHFNSLAYPRIKKADNVFDVPGKGMMWIFSSLAECGVDCSSNVLYSLYKDIIHFQQDDGGFTLHWNPSCSVACITGQIVYSMRIAGFDGKEVDTGIKWILHHQRNDGGWLHCPIGSFLDSLRFLLFKKVGNSSLRENSDASSCSVATLLCAKALATVGNDVAKNALKKALAYLLQDDGFVNEKGCKCRLSYNHELLGYPFYLDYDIVDALRLFVGINEKTHPALVRLFNVCMSKQLEDGSFPIEHKRQGCLHHFLKIPVTLKKRDALTTARVILMLLETGNATIDV